MATRRWETTFDLIGFAAYYTLMTGEFPDDDLMESARAGTGPKLVELPQQNARRTRTKKAERVAA